MMPGDRSMGGAAENQTIWSRKWPERLSQWDWQTIGLVLAIKVLVLSYGLQAIASVSLVHPNWLEIWHRWDAMHYIRLAEQGYAAVGDSRVSLVFFPLYPWLVRLTAVVTSNYMLAALIVSGAASIAAGLAFRRMVALDESEAVARNAVW
ncbi:MAG TPA: hypothetical protein VFJ88_08455, partial [Chthoniobacterales bacterium]|nr:hypothetical protein [Chthoniobacterales bacterium]